jgi:hypothetical protein
MPLSGGIDFSELNLVGQRIKFDFEFPQGGAMYVYIRRKKTP